MRRIELGEWVYDPMLGAYCYYEYPKDIGEGEGIPAPDPKIVIPRHLYEDLKDWMVKNDPHGVIRTDRKEDLKIIHRLIDVHEKLVEE